MNRMNKLDRKFTELLRRFLPEYKYIPSQDEFMDRIYIENKNSARNLAFCSIIFDTISDDILAFDITANLADPEFVEDLLCFIISASSVDIEDWVYIRVK